MVLMLWFVSVATNVAGKVVECVVCIVPLADEELMDRVGNALLLGKVNERLDDESVTPVPVGVVLEMLDASVLLAPPSKAVRTEALTCRRSSALRSMPRSCCWICRWTSSMRVGTDRVPVSSEL